MGQNFKAEQRVLVGGGDLEAGTPTMARIIKVNDDGTYDTAGVSSFANRQNVPAENLEAIPSTFKQALAKADRVMAYLNATDSVATVSLTKKEAATLEDAVADCELEARWRKYSDMYVLVIDRGLGHEALRHGTINADPLYADIPSK